MSAAWRGDVGDGPRREWDFPWAPASELKQPVLPGGASGVAWSPWVPLVRPCEQTPFHTCGLWNAWSLPQLLPGVSSSSGWVPFGFRAAMVWSLEAQMHPFPELTRHSHGLEIPRASWAAGAAVLRACGCVTRPTGGRVSMVLPTCGRGGLEGPSRAGGGGALGRRWPWAEAKLRPARVGAGPWLCGVSGLLSCGERMGSCDVPPVPHLCGQTSCGFRGRITCGGQCWAENLCHKCPELSHSPLELDQDIVWQSLRPCLPKRSLFPLYGLISVSGSWSGSSDTEGYGSYSTTPPRRRDSLV